MFDVGRVYRGVEPEPGARSARCPGTPTRARDSLRRMGDPARAVDSIPPDTFAREVALVVRGYGAVGLVEVVFFDTPGGRSAVVVTRGEDVVRDEQVRGQLSLLKIQRVAFLPEDFPVTFVGGTRVRPAPPPDNGADAVRKRSAQYRADLARMGVPLDGPEALLTPEAFDEELRALTGR